MRVLFVKKRCLKLFLFITLLMTSLALSMSTDPHEKFLVPIVVDNTLDVSGSLTLGSYNTKMVKSNTSTTAPTFTLTAAHSTPLYMKVHYLDTTTGHTGYSYSVDYWAVTTADGSAAGTLTAFNPIKLTDGTTATLGTAATLSGANVFTPGIISGDFNTDTRIVAIEVYGAATAIS